MLEKTKEAIFPWVMLGGIMYWVCGGDQIITSQPEFESFINHYRGGGFFSFGSLIIALTVSAVFMYPPAIWMLLCMKVFWGGSIRKMIFSKESWRLWLLPILLLLFIPIWIVFYAITSFTFKLLNVIFWVGLIISLLVWTFRTGRKIFYKR